MPIIARFEPNPADERPIPDELPARDITAEEWEALTPRQRGIVVSLDHWTIVAP